MDYNTVITEELSNKVVIVNIINENEIKLSCLEQEENKVIPIFEIRIFKYRYIQIFKYSNISKIY